jgi:hypothetical protein
MLEGEVSGWDQKVRAAIESSQRDEHNAMWGDDDGKPLCTSILSVVCVCVCVCAMIIYVPGY